MVAGLISVWHYSELVAGRSFGDELAGQVGFCLLGGCDGWGERGEDGGGVGEVGLSGDVG